MLKCFSVYDSKTEAFIQPFYSQATGAAIRSFETAANEEGHDFKRHGADYTLFELGSFDQSSGRFELLDAPLNLGLALTFVRTLGDLERTQRITDQAGDGKIRNIS